MASAKQDLIELDLQTARLGVIGGSGLYAMDGLEDVRKLKIKTPYGKPSDALRLGRIGDLEVVFLARHGRHHSFTPSEVPYQANIWALRSLGVRWILSVSAVGSLQEHVRPLDMVVPDQFIDRTHQRPPTLFGDGLVAHVGFGDPFCPALARLLAELYQVDPDVRPVRVLAAEALLVRLHEGPVGDLFGSVFAYSVPLKHLLDAFADD